LNKSRYFTYLACGFIVFLVSIYGFILIQGRLELPPDINIQRLLGKDKFMVKLDGLEIKHERDIEFVMSQKRIRNQLIVLFDSGNGEVEEVRLPRLYAQAPFPVLNLVIGLFCLAIGFVVFILRPEEREAIIFFWASLAFSSAIIISGGYHCLKDNSLSYIPGILFYLAYPFAPALLVHFSLALFTRIKPKDLIFIYMPAVIFALVLEATFLVSSLKSSLDINRLYQMIFYIFRFYIVIFALISIVSLVINLRRASLEASRAQIKWILYGLFFGLGPFIFLYQLPQVLRARPFISEDFSIVFFIFIPIALAFSIVKYKLMNIELIINRSLVYGSLTIFTVSLYIFSVYIFQNIFQIIFHIKNIAVFALAALAAAAAFHPARKKIQEFVDKSFYRLSYDYRKTILSFNEKAQKMISQEHLINFFLVKIQNVLPLEHIGIYLLSETENHPVFITRGQEKDINNIAPFFLKSNQVLSRKDALKTEAHIDIGRDELLKEKGLELVFPLTFRYGALSGCLTLGKKMSGDRFSHDDLDLLQSMTGELILNLERIRLQEEVIYERTEIEKLDELNRLKTEFIATVSHELRTPMSSIRGMSEVLQEGRLKDDAKRDELIKLMASESGRLSRLLHNILDFGKIEQQAKAYNFQKTEICSMVKETVDLFQHHLQKEGFMMRMFLPPNPVYLTVDQDAIKEALTNLIDNAIKYSAEKREIDIEIIEMESQVEIQVRDKGIGIALEEQEKIFDKFYRVPEAVRIIPKGVGLGLKIVKHIMEAHKGEIRVESQPHKGSIFCLVFPKS
jgi:signal transduction histidine kinase